MKYNYTSRFMRLFCLLALLGLSANQLLKAQALTTNKIYIVNGANDVVAPVDTFANLAGPATGPAYGAMNYLNTYGVTLGTAAGQMTFLLSSGYSGIEPDVINIGTTSGVGGWPGMYLNASSPIVIKPASGLNFTITTSNSIVGNGALVRFNAAWFASIDGEGITGQRNISFKMPVSASSISNRIIDIMPTTGQQCQYVTVKNCNLSGNSFGTDINASINTFAGIYLGGPSYSSAVALAKSENLTFTNNAIYGTQYGIYVRGKGNAANSYERNITISNNIIGGYVNPVDPNTTPYTGAFNTAGIYVNSCANVIVDNNTIMNASINASGYRGIFLTHEGGVAGTSVDSNIQVTRNTIKNLNISASGGVYGIRMNLSSHPTAPQRILMANNAISNLSAINAQTVPASFSYPIGILVEDISANVGLEVYFNSINLFGSNLPNSALSACFVTSGNTTGGIISMNNIFSNKMGALNTNQIGYSVYGVLALSTASPFLYSNFNNYFVSSNDGGFSFEAGLGTNRYTSLRAFRNVSPSDSNSLSAIPPFTNDTTLTVPNGLSHVLYNRGVSLTQFFQFNLSIYNQMNNRVSTDIFNNARTNLGRFTSMGCHLWNGDSTNFNTALVAPRTFPINGFSSYPTILNQNGSFATLADAIRYLNAYGVSGSGQVTLELQPGYVPDTTYLPAIQDYPGASIGVPVVIRTQTGFSTTIGMPTNVTVNMQNTSILRFEGARWVTIDGRNRNLTFAMPANATTVNSRVISITTFDLPCNDITIRNCRIVGNSNTNAVNTSAGIYFGSPSTASGPTTATIGGFDKITLTNNEISAVRTGIYFGAASTTTNTLINRNIIGGSVAPGGTANTTYIGGAANQAGIYLRGLTNASIDSNVIRNCFNLSSTSTGFRGIDMDEQPGNTAFLFNNVTLSRNFIYRLETQFGSYCVGIRVYLSGLDTINSRAITLQNNFIGSILGTGLGTPFSNQNPAGIMLDAASTHPRPGISLAHNTVNMTGSGLLAGNAGSAALFINSQYRGGVAIVNNIFGNRIVRQSSTGNRYSVAIGYSASPFSTANTILPFASNNNCFFATGNGTNYTISYSSGGINKTSINDLRIFTGGDGNSFNWITGFNTDTTPDLKLINAGLNPNGASLVALICNDIYGNPRYLCAGSGTSGRWVGAYESGNLYPALQGGATYQINGTDNPPTSGNPNTGSFKTVRSAVNYLNSQGVDGSFGGAKTVTLQISSGYVGETDSFTGPITIYDYPRQNPSRTVVLTLASGRTDTIRIVSTIDPAVVANASVIRFSGGKYFTIDGSNSQTTTRDLAIVAPSAFNSFTNKVVDIVTGVDPVTATVPNSVGITIKNTNIAGQSTTTTNLNFAGIYMGGLTTPSNGSFGRNDNLIVQNNSINSVNYGIYLRGYSRRDSMDAFGTISGNTIGGTIAPGGSANTTYFGGTPNAAGIFLMGQANITVANNSIQNNIRTVQGSRGIELAAIAGQYTGLDSIVRINGNIISNIGSDFGGGAYGVLLNFGNDSSNTQRNITLSNNMIYNIYSAGSASGNTAGFFANPYGVFINAGANMRYNGNTNIGVNLLYNSINLGLSTTGLANAGANSACLGIAPQILGGITSLNNIFQNRFGGIAGTDCYGVAIGGTANPFLVSDYNNYYTTEPSASNNNNMASGVAAAGRIGYNQWYEILGFTQQDTMSISFLAPFPTDNNLFIPLNTLSVFSGSAKPLSSAVYGSTILTDINGTSRNINFPTLGAVEFTSSPSVYYSDSVAPRVFNVTDQTACFSGSVVFNFRVYDRNQNKDTLYYRVNGGTISSVQATNPTGVVRNYALPTLPGSALVEFRVSAIDLRNPPNTGAYPMFKTWDTLNLNITTFPFTTSFEGVNNPIWQTQTMSGGATWQIGSLGSPINPPLGSRTGLKSVLFAASGYGAGAAARLVSPCLYISNMKSPTLRFYISQNSGLPNKLDSIAVRISYGGNFWSNPIKSVKRYNPNFTFPGWQVVEVCLAEFVQTPAGLRIGIEGYAAGAGQNILIDDITIFDDAQVQNFTPKVFSQCFRDSVTINVTNSDLRYTYTAANLNGTTILSSRLGTGSTLPVRFMAPAVDTLRAFVLAVNNFSTVNSTGFGGGQVSCTNVMPDTITAYINRFYNGPFITAGTPFSGSFNAGDLNNPDGARVGDTITYKFVAPAFYTNADYNSKWSVASVTAKTLSGTNFTGFTTVAPVGNNDGYVRLFAPANYLDSTIQFTFQFRLLASSCDSIVYRALKITTAPTANFNTNPTTNFCALNTIQFDGGASTLPLNNFPFSFTWVWGDNTTGGGSNPQKIYTNPGTYTVKMFVTDRYGLTSISQRNITVLPAPIVDFTTSTPCSKDSVLFNPTTQPAGSTFNWSFPNNTVQTRQNAKYSFVTFDTTYKVNLTITNTSGCSNSVSKNLYVFAKPTANFTTTAHCLGVAVPLTNSSSIPSGVIGYNWSWGNGQTGLGQTPTYKFPASGSYAVTLKVTSNFGCTDSLTRAVTVNEKPNVDFSIANPCANSPSVVTNKTTFTGGLQNLNFSWNFGDQQFSTVQNPAKTYQAIGTYNVSLLSVDKLNGCRDSATKSIQIFYAPKAQFNSAPATSVCIGNPVQLFNSSYTIDGSTYTCAWTFGDGNSAVACNTAYSYTTAGAYNIKLVVTTGGNNGSCQDSMTKPMTVVPTPTLTIDTAYVEIPSFPYCKNKVKFTPNVKAARDYTWKFGDADSSTSNQQSPSFVYNKGGVFNGSLSVLDTNGCTLFQTFKVFVQCAVGVQEAMANQFNLSAYPNPFGSNTNLKFELKDAANVRVSVINTLGQTVKSADYGKLMGGKHELNLDDTFFGAAGAYQVRVTIDESNVYKQVIKQ